eukprot:gene9089-12259_t
MQLLFVFIVMICDTRITFSLLTKQYKSYFLPNNPLLHQKLTQYTFSSCRQCSSSVFSDSNTYSGFSSIENPPFFPKTTEELAQDVAFSTKIGLISSIKRLRVDIKCRLIAKDRLFFEWLFYFVSKLFDEKLSTIHVYIDKKYSMEYCKTIAQTINNLTIIDFLDDKIVCHVSTHNKFNFERNSNSNSNDNDNIDHDIEKLNSRFIISYTTNEYIYNDDEMYIIFCPDNIKVINDSESDLLESVQTICFHGALRCVPVLMINPLLIATAWNNYGARTPLLLGDFAQIYYICDDYFMLTSKDRWVGVIQRAATGFDLFDLEGLNPSSNTPSKYKRVKSWPDGMPNDMRTFLARYLLKEPTFIANNNNDNNNKHSNNHSNDNRIESYIHEQNKNGNSWKKTLPPPSFLSKPTKEKKL